MFQSLVALEVSPFPTPKPRPPCPAVVEGPEVGEEWVRCEQVPCQP